MQTMIALLTKIKQFFLQLDKKEPVIVKKQSLHQLLTSRMNRLLHLRNLAIEQRNIAKKKQAEYLIRQIQPRLNNLHNFSLN